MPRFGFGPSFYPRSLRVLIALAAILPISLAALIASSALQMLGIAYDIPQLVYGTALMERLGWISLGFAWLIAGGIGIAGLFSKARWRGELAARSKVKNAAVAPGLEITYDAKRLLDSLSRTERELLRRRLAESRLAVRHDGVLIAREQAEMMRKIETFLLL